jgi:hypothetical protein
MIDERVEPGSVEYELIEERDAKITEYPEWGVLKRTSWTRSLADESSFGIAGNEMLDNRSIRRRGADPPKNESGRTRSVFLFIVPRLRWVSSGNGSIIAAANRFK